MSKKFNSKSNTMSRTKCSNWISSWFRFHLKRVIHVINLISETIQLIVCIDWCTTPRAQTEKKLLYVYKSQKSIEHIESVHGSIKAMVTRRIPSHPLYRVGMSSSFAWSNRISLLYLRNYKFSQNDSAHMAPSLDRCQQILSPTRAKIWEKNDRRRKRNCDDVCIFSKQTPIVCACGAYFSDQISYKWIRAIRHHECQTNSVSVEWHRGHRMTLKRYENIDDYLCWKETRWQVTSNRAWSYCGNVERQVSSTLEINFIFIWYFSAKTIQL